MDEVQAFYDKNAQNEWDRLDHHKTEFAVTLRALKDYLPHLPAEVLDVGGGVRADILSPLRNLDTESLSWTFPRAAFSLLRRRPRKQV